MLDSNYLLPSEVGVYITSESAEADPEKMSKSMKRSYEKFGFKNEQELIEYIKDNMDIDDYIMLYTYEKQFNQSILKPICCGTKEEVLGLE